MTDSGPKQNVEVLAPALLRRYDAALAVVDRVSAVTIMTAMAILTVVLIVQVFFRYVLNYSLTWGWDVPRLCFIWVVMLAIPLGLKRGVHVGITLVLELLQMQQQRLLHRFNALLMIGLMSLIGYYAVILGHATWDQLLPGIDFSVGWFYVAMFICAVHSVLHLLRLLWTGAPPQPEVGSE